MLPTHKCFKAGSKENCVLKDFLLWVPDAFRAPLPLNTFYKNHYLPLLLNMT